MSREGSYVVKCVLVGDGSVGKTCLLHKYTSSCFPEGYTQTPYIPTIFDTYTCTLKYEMADLKLSLFDTAGQEDYDRFRILCYQNPSADILILCFSVVSNHSYDNIIQKWKSELEIHCPGVPIMLLATKVDLRTDQTQIQTLAKTGERIIPRENGEKLAKQLGAVCYQEVSAFTGVGVKEAFECAIRIGLQKSLLISSSDNKIRSNLRKSKRQSTLYVKEKCILY